MIKPIFIFSLPRSGSTLLQRILTTHGNIESVSEPWILLPLLYALRNKGVFAEYAHMSLVQATKDIIEELPKGEEDYYKAIRAFALDIYQNLSHEGAIYFIDKTPRYHLVVDKIIQTFPDGKFIFLWRHPLAIAASIMTMSNHKGTWKDIYRYGIDLYDGFENLYSSSMKHHDKSITITYEQLVNNPQAILDNIANYLDIDFPANTIENSFTRTQFKGRLGDKSGYSTYKLVSSDSIDKWKTVMRSPLRKIWCKRYLSWIGEDRLHQIGYNYDEIIKAINVITPNFSRLVIDVFEYINYGVSYFVFDPSILKNKIRSRLNGERVHPLY